MLKYKGQLFSFFEVSINEAKSLFLESKFEKSLEICNKLLEIDNNSIDVLIIFYKSMINLGRQMEAIPYINRLIKLDPENPEFPKDLGNIYQLSGNNELARESYKKAIKIDNLYAPALTNLGILEIINGNKDALDFLIKATEIDPNLAPAWGNLANAFIQLGMLNEAEKACRKALDVNPNFAKSHVMLESIKDQKMLKEIEKTNASKNSYNPIIHDSCFSVINYQSGPSQKILYAFTNAGHELITAETFINNPNTIPIVWGFLGDSAKVLRFCIENDWPFLYVDHAYLKHGHVLGNYRIAVSSFSAIDFCRLPSDRFNSLEIDFVDWRRTGSDVLVCPPSEDFKKFFPNTEKWLEKTLETIKSNSDREIIIRSKYRDSGGTAHFDEPLDLALKSCHAVVTYSSNVAIDSILSGVPSFVDISHCASILGNTDQKLIDSPKYQELPEFFNFLSYNQFSLNEISSGKALDVLSGTYPGFYEKTIQKFHSLKEK